MRDLIAVSYHCLRFPAELLVNRTPGCRQAAASTALALWEASLALLLPCGGRWPGGNGGLSGGLTDVKAGIFVDKVFPVDLLADALFLGGLSSDSARMHP